MFILLSRLGRLFVGTLVVIAVTSIIGFSTLTTSLVASESNGPHSGNGTSSLTLVLLNSTDGLPHYGQSVTFKASTTATTQPYVGLDCYQNGALVLGAVAGFYPSYPWPGSQIMTLSTASWTSGGANCIATLYYPSGKKNVTLSTLNFQVYA